MFDALCISDWNTLYNIVVILDFFGGNIDVFDLIDLLSCAIRMV